MQHDKDSDLTDTGRQRGDLLRVRGIELADCRKLRARIAEEYREGNSII